MNQKITITLSFLLILLTTAACSLAPVAEPLDSSENNPTDTFQPIIEVTTQLPVINPTETITTAPASTATGTNQVIITAATGSLAIRRGPGTAYNRLGFLQDGQSAVASARDASGSWLYIPIPAYPSTSGWVSTGTIYSTIAGEISSLQVMNVSPAEPITIRNCTYHPMLITPLNITLAPQNEIPGNLAVVLPGDYSTFDQSVGSIQVKTMSLQEGAWVDITTDGLGNSYTCP